MQVSFNYSYLG